MPANEQPPAILESPDGRLLILRMSGDVPAAGDLVEISSGDSRISAYVEDVGDEDPVGVRAVVGSLLGCDGSLPGRRPQEVQIVPAEVEQVVAAVAGPDARLHLGNVASMPDAAVGLEAGRMNRHTFWCGQSGSGKTYALGVALERLLSATRLPMIVFDPNSDFVHLGEIRPEADDDDAKHLAGRDVVVLRPDDPDHPLRVGFRQLRARSQAAVLRLDPVLDRAEYNAFLRFAEELKESTPGEDADLIPEYLRSRGDPDSTALAERIENLGVLDWKRTWAVGGGSAIEIVDRRPAATVVDLGQYGRHEEQLTVVLAVLEHLWEHRAERRPVLLVLDEAHNFCPPDPETPLGVAVRDLLVQIAAEGRKYGLWLLLSTQRPSKIHHGVLSQCDNLTLMRMNSPADLEELSRIFGFVPRQLLDRVPRFIQGEALFAGSFVRLPVIVKVRNRVTPEGGADVQVPTEA